MGAVTLAKKSLGENASETAIAILASTIVREGLQQEIYNLYDVICEHAK
jgi:hypothetical protein